MEKLPIARWQYDEIENLLQAHMGWEAAEKHVADTYTLIEPSGTYSDLPLKYLIFGYKQDAVMWRLENDVAIEDTILARDWEQLNGLHARLKPIYANREWYRLNRNHNIVRQATYRLYTIERMYGHVL